MKIFNRTFGANTSSLGRFPTVTKKRSLTFMTTIYGSWIRRSMIIEPGEFTGIWHRESLTIEQGDPFEDSDAYWLQAGDYFADMRWSLDETRTDTSSESAFAGRTSWSPPKMRFVHVIDFTKQFLEDEGRLMMVDGKLWEHGQVNIEGKTIHFKEVWVPLHINNQNTVVATVVDTPGEIGYFIRVGEFAIGMNESKGVFSAACWRQLTATGEWRSLHCIGDPEHLESLTNGYL